MTPSSRTSAPLSFAALALVAAILILLLTPAPASAAWPAFGAPVSTAANAQDQVAAVPDGAGGMIVVWRDQRSDAGDIYVQRLNGAGNLLWAPAGVPLCTAANLQQLPQIVSDDAGGAIVVWQDNRSDPFGDIYAQRVDGSGAVLWFANGVPLVTGAGQNIETVARFRMIRDGVGGAIFTFCDSRNSGGVSEPGVPKVWAERVTSFGSPLWTPGGVPVAADAGLAFDNAAPVSDGLGGVIVAYQAGAIDIAAKRLDASGAVAWGAVPVCTAPDKQSFPDIVSDGEGGAVIAWVDNRFDANGDIYAQRLDAGGVAQWSVDGNVLVTGPSANNAGEYVIRMLQDDAGGVTLAFSDDRKENGVPDPGFGKVWAQRVDLFGTPLWGNGIPVAGGPGIHAWPRIVTDTEGGSIVVWQDGTSPGNLNIFARRLDPFGGYVWGSSVSVCNALGQQSAPAAVADGVGGVLAAWSDARGGTADVYANMTDFAGVPGANARWRCTSYRPDGAVVTNTLNAQDQVVTASDGAGGLFIAWRDQRSDAGDIYAQHVNNVGLSLWDPEGVAICTAVNMQAQPRIVSDLRGGAIIAWQDNRIDGNGDMYAQRIDALGVTQWTADGNVMVFGPSRNTQTLSGFRMIEDGTGGAIFTFRDNRHLGGTLDPAYTKVWAQRISSTGVAAWGPTGTHVGIGANAQENGAPISDGLGGVIVAWQDGSSGTNFDISVQRVDHDAVQRWGLMGVVICNAANSQLVPDITSDGAGGAIVAWSDARVDPRGDVYAQRLNPLGSPLWAPNGVAQVTGPSINDFGEHLIRMIPDGAGGAYLAFADNRDFGGVPDLAFSKVWAQHIKPSGSPDWASGVPVGAGAGYHGYHQIVSDGEGGMVIVWQDGSPGAAATDISAQRLRSTGASYWSAGGVKVSAAAAAQSIPSVTTDGRGHAIAAWTDTRFGPADVFAQRVCVPNAMTVAVPVEAGPGAPAALGAPVPNPTFDAVAYTLKLGSEGPVRVFLSDIRGRVVERLIDRVLEPGEHRFTWSRRGAAGRLAAGVYFLCVERKGAREARKFVLLN